MSNKKRRPGRPAKYPPEFQRDAVANLGRNLARPNGVCAPGATRAVTLPHQRASTARAVRSR